ncbi:hypothetical protein FSP39_017995 [Pinctada imbricata]|uniref:Transporter n=1 Tax=Pinctada imbricata TaxID=66713 RepID=A0AA88XNY0_PINIB|nr:hypothetical protein FSP39_017995 [Pinctada imbricata]
MSEVKAALLSNGRPRDDRTDQNKTRCPNGDADNAACNGAVNSDRNRDLGQSEGGGAEREQWGKKLDFLLSVIGFAVDLGNVWRFPYICYKNGGGAFLIPYGVMLIFLGLPLFYMELALGQFQRCGVINVWDRICPMFRGVGYGICFVATFVGMYYNTIIAIALYYMISSFRSEVPWASCDNDWNTPGCTSLASYNKSSNYTDPAAWQYYQNKVLGANNSKGIHDIGPPKWELVLCLMAVFVVVYFCLWKGIKSSGKAVWVTATVPYIVLVILLVRGCTLPGARDGIIYYLTPKWHRLTDVNVWLDAVAQIFFSLGPGFGTLLALSSYNKFNNNCYLDAIVVSIINCLTSFMAGFVVFSVLGYMAHKLGKLVENVATEGPGLVFLVYPEVISTLDGSVFWAIIFFLMLITLGLDSTFGGLEAVITAVCDAYPAVGRKRELFVLAIIIYCFLGALSTCTYGGEYVLALLDRHAAPISLVFICFVESVAVNWFYGVQKFSNDIEAMLGFRPGIYWRVCWAGICPICLLGLFIVSCIDYRPLVLGTYKYPDWATAVGWCVSALSIISIPVYIVYKFIITPGNLKQVNYIFQTYSYFSHLTKNYVIYKKISR